MNKVTRKIEKLLEPAKTVLVFGILYLCQIQQKMV